MVHVRVIWYWRYHKIILIGIFRFPLFKNPPPLCESSSVWVPHPPMRVPRTFVRVSRPPGRVSAHLCTFFSSLFNFRNSLSFMSVNSLRYPKHICTATTGQDWYVLQGLFKRWDDRVLKIYNFASIFRLKILLLKWYFIILILYKHLAPAPSKELCILSNSFFVYRFDTVILPLFVCLPLFAWNISSSLHFKLYLLINM